MEALGQLAGGVAHDFNNLLTAIMGYCQLSLNSAPAQSRLETNLKEIARAADRASGLTRQLLAFSSRQVIQTRIFDINDLILDMDKMMARLIGENIELVTLPAAKPGSVKADPGQMETVLVNLLVNAREAMPDGGKLVIETENVTSFTGPSSESDSGAETSDLRGSAFIKISVADDGAGMSDAVKARVFEPFFTAKSAGRGTGLGLSTCYGVISRLGDRISVDSAEGVGTRIDVLLPAVGGEITHSVTRTEPELINVGRESLMLVEDEESVRKVVAQALRGLGYQVMEAANGRAALDLSDLLGPDGVDLLITDVIMPGMSGRDLADEFTSRWPDTKVLFVSGYADGLGDLATGDGKFTYMGKPFTPNALSAKVREVLNNPEVEAKSAWRGPADPPMARMIGMVRI
jgi:CheY-like chemotaxis protein